MFPGSDIVYKLMYVVGFAIMMIINLKTCDSHLISKKEAVLHTLFTYAAGVAGAMIMGKIYTAVAAPLGDTNGSNVAIFGAVVFTPIFLILLFLIDKTDIKENMDMFAPGIFAILACAKFGCMCEGCCAGFAWEHGIYNPKLDMRVFPVQIFEVVTMIAVICLTQLFFKKTKNYVDGTAYPITAAVYSVTRFCWEEARYYPDERLKHILGVFTFWQIWCIIVFIVCTVITILLYRETKKLAEYKAKKKKKRL